jgi:succinate-acetate transporter protein
METSAVSAPKLANPAPLGLASFGLTTIILSLINAGLLPKEALPVVVPLAFAYGGGAQIIAGILEFRTGNTFGMVAFSSYGFFWWWFALLQWSIGAGVLKAPAPVGGAATLMAWGVFTLLMWVVSFRLAKAVWGIFGLLWITFFLLAAGDLGNHALGMLGGWVGLATGALALLTAFAEVMNATAGREVIRLGAPFVKS